MYRFHKIIFSLILLAAASEIIAQEKPREYSPYSRLGIGDMADPHFSVLSQMGGVAAGFADRNILNFSNPAALGSLRNTAFEVGVSAKFTTLSDPNNSQKFFGGGLDYLALGVPVFNPINEALDRVNRKLHWGMMFALKPFSHVGYDISQTDSLAGTGRYTRKYLGSGGSYEFKWGHGFDYKNFSFGLGVGFVFGKMSYLRQLDLLSVSFPYSTVFLDEISMNGFKWNSGLQYKFNLTKIKEGESEASRSLTMGIYGQTNQSFNTKSTHFYSRQLIIGDAVNTEDTLRNEKDILANGTLPGELHLGVYYNDRYKLQAGAQINLISWSAYKNEAKPEILKNSSSFSLGLAYTPDLESLNNLLKRITYRFGLKIGNDPRSLDSEQIKSYSVTFGVGVPFVFQRKVSFANIGVEIGNTGLTDKLNSRYAQLKLGFTLNDDEWFLKKKYN